MPKLGQKNHFLIESCAIMPLTRRFGFEKRKCSGFNIELGVPNRTLGQKRIRLPHKLGLIWLGIIPGLNDGRIGLILILIEKEKF